MGSTPEIVSIYLSKKYLNLRVSSVLQGQMLTIYFNNRAKKTKNRKKMITIKSNEVLRYLELKSKGYKTLWVGNGLICLAP